MKISRSVYGILGPLIRQDSKESVRDSRPLPTPRGGQFERAFIDVNPCAQSN